MASFRASDLFSVSNKVVLVTGGSRGIGKAVRCISYSMELSDSITVTILHAQIATAFVSNGAKVGEHMSFHTTI